MGSCKGRIVTLAVALTVCSLGAAFAAEAQTAVRAHNVAALQARVSITTALEIAEQHARGPAFKIELALGKTGPEYRVFTGTRERLSHVIVSATDGIVGRVDERERLRGFFDAESARILSRVAAAPVALAAAITAAERRVGGRAVEAAVENEMGTLVYAIEVIREGRLTIVAIDPDSGAVIRASVEE
jgi:Peptidase propeptide and YPEB domain